MWTSVTMRLDGEMVMSRPHAHSNLLDLILVFEGTAADVGLDEGIFTVDIRAGAPVPERHGMSADDVKRKLIARLVAADGRLVCAWSIPGLERPPSAGGPVRPDAADRPAPQRRRVAVPELVVLGRHAAHRRVLLAPGATEAYQHTNWRGHCRPPSAPRPPAGGGRHRPTTALSAAAFAAARAELWCARRTRRHNRRHRAAAAAAARGDADAPLNSETLCARCSRTTRRVDALHCPKWVDKTLYKYDPKSRGCRASSETLSSLTTRTRRRARRTQAAAARAARGALFG